MREILFRGQRIDNGEWVKGDLLQVIIKGLPLKFIIPHGISCEKNEKISVLQIEVEPETVGQFTGLTDKNGVKIFEGDILLFGDKNFAVEWQNDIVGFGYFYTSDRVLCSGGINCEVIGNIHKNPELLK